MKRACYLLARLLAFAWALHATARAELSSMVARNTQGQVLERVAIQAGASQFKTWKADEQSGNLVTPPGKLNPAAISSQPFFEYEIVIYIKTQ